MRALALRPPGTRDLAALERHATQQLQAWARGWLAGGRASAQLSTAPGETAGVPPADARVRLGRLCLGSPAAPGGDGLPQALCAAIGDAALDALARALGLLAGASPAAARTLGLRLAIATDGPDLVLDFAWPHAAWAEALPPVRRRAQPPGRYALPAAVERVTRRVELRSTAFELAVADLLAMAAGDVLVLDQALDEPFQLALPGLPGAALQAHLGRRGTQLAAELLPL